MQTEEAGKQPAFSVDNSTRLIRINVSSFQNAPPVSGFSQKQVDLPTFPAVVGYLFRDTHFDYA